MNRDIARRNTRIGIAFGVVSSVMFGISFLAALVYNAA